MFRPTPWHNLCFSNVMKIAFSVWEQRIAPVFDTARQIYLVECNGRQIATESAHIISGDTLSQKVTWLTEQGVDTLVCGAVSRQLQIQLTTAGIKLMPFVAGALRQVIQATLDGSLKSAAFAMPGCCGRRRLRQRQGTARCCATRTPL